MGNDYDTRVQRVRTLTQKLRDVMHAASLAINQV